MEKLVTISRKEYDQLEAQAAELTEAKAKLTEAEAEIDRLQSEIALLKNGRNSKTSSTPPSQDIARSNTHNLRVKSGKPSGGQTGHKGHTLIAKEDADEIIEHVPCYCQGCGHSLESVNGAIESPVRRRLRPSSC